MARIPQQRRTGRVLIADDHALLRSSLGALIADDPALELVASCPDGETAVRQVALALPDLVLMDLRMPGMDGIEATRRIRTAHPQVRVAVLTGQIGVRRTAEALAAGACCVLTKDLPPAELLGLIREHAVPL